MSTEDTPPMPSMTQIWNGRRDGEEIVKAALADKETAAALSLALGLAASSMEWVAANFPLPLILGFLSASLIDLSQRNRLGTQPSG